MKGEGHTLGLIYLYVFEGFIYWLETYSLEEFDWTWEFYKPWLSFHSSMRFIRNIHDEGLEYSKFYIS